MSAEVPHTIGSISTIRMINVGHHFDGQPWLFRGVDFDFTPGRSYALTGPSGSGKSTLLSLLAGWDRPKEGEIIRGPALSAKWVFQNPFGIRSRMARDHVVLPLMAQNRSRNAAEVLADEFLDSVGLGAVASRRFSELSGGEAQRLMLARGLASAPDLLLVDEPTAQLDSRTAQTVNEALASVKKSMTVVVVATHDERTRDACDQSLDLFSYSKK